MADVFISYARDDRKIASRLDAELRRAGFTTWWDTRLIAGDSWNDEIRAALAAARCVIVLWSRRSWGSRWVQAEAQDGFRRDVLIQARLDDVPLEVPFNTVQTADCRGLREATGLAELVNGVAAKLGEGAIHAPPPRRIGPVLAASLVGLAVSAGGLWAYSRFAASVPAGLGSVAGTWNETGLGDCATNALVIERAGAALTFRSNGASAQRVVTGNREGWLVLDDRSEVRATAGQLWIRPSQAQAAAEFTRCAAR